MLLGVSILGLRTQTWDFPADLDEIAQCMLGVKSLRSWGKQ
jgi:hypothetical protein